MVPGRSTIPLTRSPTSTPQVASPISHPFALTTPPPQVASLAPQTLVPATPSPQISSPTFPVFAPAELSASPTPEFTMESVGNAPPHIVPIMSAPPPDMENNGDHSGNVSPGNSTTTVSSNAGTSANPPKKKERMTVKQVICAKSDIAHTHNSSLRRKRCFAGWSEQTGGDWAAFCAIWEKLRQPGKQVGCLRFSCVVSSDASPGTQQMAEEFSQVRRSHESQASRHLRFLFSQKA